MKIRRWKHPAWSMELITHDHESTRTDALECLGDDDSTDELTFTADEISVSEFENLPEFEA